MSTAINSKIDFDALARQVLPDRADVLAPAIASGVQSQIHSRLSEFTASPRFQELWTNANRQAHSRIVALLTGGRSKRLELQGDTVYLDLSPAVQRVKDALNERGLTRISAAIPPIGRRQDQAGPVERDHRRAERRSSCSRRPRSCCRSWRSCAWPRRPR